MSSNKIGADIAARIRLGRAGYLVPDGVAVPTLELWQTFEHETATAIIGGVQTWEYENRNVTGATVHSCKFAQRCTDAVSLRLLTRNMPGVRQGESVEASLRIAAAVREYAHRRMRPQRAAGDRGVVRRPRVRRWRMAR